MSTPATQSIAGLDRLYDAIQSIVPGVTFPVVQMVVWDAIDEFCQRSTAWRETMEWTLPPGDREVDLNPVGPNAMAAWVLDVRGLVRYSVSPPAIIVDSGDVSQARTGYALVACKPTRLTSSVPSWMLQLWFEGLKDGALGRLYQQPAKPYSSQPLTQAHLTRFRQQIRLARDGVNRYNTGGNSGWAFPRFASGSGGNRTRW